MCTCTIVKFQVNEKNCEQGAIMANERLLGTVISVGALRGTKAAAVGEFLDLGEFALLCKKMNIGLIQLLPVNDTGYESSPYSSLTAFALHPLYLRIAALPEAEGFKDKAAAIDTEFAGLERFSYQKVLRAKMALLQDIYAANATKIIQRANKGGDLGTDRKSVV